MRIRLPISLVLATALVTAAARAADAPASAAAHLPAKRILILHSFSRDFAPYSVLSTAFKTELVRVFSGPVQFYEISLDAVRLDSVEEEQSAVNFLKVRFAQHPPALVVPLGGPAALFIVRNRQRLFPDTPTLLVGVDERHLRTVQLGPRDAAVRTSMNLAALLGNIFQVLPQTTHLVIVLGGTPLERFWRGEFEKEIGRLGRPVSVTWCNDLSLQQIQAQAAILPDHSAILYGLMVVDGAGVPHEHDAALTAIHRAARAPLFGAFESQLGLGIVGGPLLSTQEVGRQAARTAREMLADGSTPVGRAAIGLGRPVYDWRELNRWGISEQRLPADHTILYRPLSRWQEYGGVILIVASAFVLQSVLIAALLLQRSKRRRAERDSRSLAGRLLTAHEDEHRRLARELHDDLTQRLARLTIDVARLEQSSANPAGQQQAVAVRDELVRLSEDVHALSYRLHPSMLDDLGLVDALRAECNSFWRRESIPVQIHAQDLRTPVPREMALCLYRITQEALRNVARHARARAVDVSLRQADGGVQLAISDDGIGFDPQENRARPSLGHASMRERVHLLGGELDIESTPGHGSTISAWVPLKGVSS